MKILKTLILVFSCVVFLLHFFFLTFAFYESVHQNYLYFSVDAVAFVFSLCLSLFLPLCGILCFALALKGICKRKVSKIIVLILSVVLIVLNTISLPVAFYTVLWGEAGFASITEDFSNYGLYDSFVVNTLQEFSAENILPPKSQLSSASTYRYFANAYTEKKHTLGEEHTFGDSKEIFSEYFKIELHAEFIKHEYFMQAVEKLNSQQKKLEQYGAEMNIIWDIKEEANIIDYVIGYIY